MVCQSVCNKKCCLTFFYHFICIVGLDVNSIFTCDWFIRQSCDSKRNASDSSQVLLRQWINRGESWSVCVSFFTSWSYTTLGWRYVPEPLYLWCHFIQLLENTMHIHFVLWEMIHGCFCQRHACLCATGTPLARKSRRSVWELWWRCRKWFHHDAGHSWIHTRAIWELLEG